jgi:hypothetical protein
MAFHDNAYAMEIDGASQRFVCSGLSDDLFPGTMEYGLVNLPDLNAAY